MEQPEMKEILEIILIHYTIRTYSFLIGSTYYPGVALSQINNQI